MTGRMEKDSKALLPHAAAKRVGPRRKGFVVEAEKIVWRSAGGYLRSDRDQTDEAHYDKLEPTKG